MALGTAKSSEPNVDRSIIVLTIASGMLQGLSISATSPNELLVGRAQHCHFRVFDPRMSREHFKIHFSGGRWWVDDLASSNGTLVDSQTIVTSVALRNGDVVQSGDTRFLVSLAEDITSRFDTANSAHRPAKRQTPENNSTLSD